MATSAEPRPRTTVAVYDSYADAERAVDYLSDHDYPVERASIVGATCVGWSRSRAG
jgi:hypothetical protein